ncbi:transcriptional regulator [Cloacibacterium normanense]|jgi:transcriptional regulator with XRE-family HTH domain|uniref:Transcriptional regulator n=1 Tax=Cloacibacterium normanense TaxID=237258 RepID=A0A2S7I363_9FLAO|nr:MULTISPECIES: helix-turn-helix transcriptional regulator [Weeksellaceae]PPZ91003.1 transcriptional regulator [Cloacibacterium normanense]QQM27907.1 helix-turn-helix transcriptional regulator [Elizabethkingia sp. M8]
MLFISSSKAQKKIAENVRERRLQMDLTQEGLAERSGVPLSTLRKFEQKGNISLESFLKLLSVIGGLEEVINALKPNIPNFKSIDDVLKTEAEIIKKRGRKK